MKKIVFLIFILGICYSCQNKVEQMLTDYNWEIEKVVDLKNGTIKQTKTNQEKVWDFAENNTYQYKTKSENKENMVNGKWTLNGFNLQIFNEFDTTNVIIEEIDNEKMVWLMNQNDTIKFYLSSKVKEPIVPNFPNVTK